MMIMKNIPGTDHVWSDDRGHFCSFFEEGREERTAGEAKVGEQYD